MSNKQIGFFTGARSDYGIMKNFISAIDELDNYGCQIFVSGLHLLKSFGNTISEIENDGFEISDKIFAFEENVEPGYEEFTFLLNSLSAILVNRKLDYVFLLGDRVETYAAALACHFSQTKIIHFGGGTITKGAYDNIYRYNISNLAEYHFATSKGNYKRLISLPTIEKNHVFFTGSFAIDAINKFKKNPISIDQIIPELKRKKFCLMTYHSVTDFDEPIADIMDFTIKIILNKGFDILITYPNNDPGYKDILLIIEKWKDNKNVHIREHLGAKGYYSALNGCSFVCGNSSSGIIEAPYFGKKIFNIGNRQKGREMDKLITSIPCNESKIRFEFEENFNNNKVQTNCEEIYGGGNALEKVIEIFKNDFRKNI